MAVRAALIAVVVAAWCTGVAGHGVRASWGTVAGLLGPYLALSALLSLIALSALALTARGRQVALAAVALGVAVDGLALVGVRELIWTAPTGVLLPAILLSAACLLASFRTGVKLAVWQSLLAVADDSARRAGLVAPTGPLPEIGAELLLLWLLVIVIGSAAAVSERELRRRRYDAEALQHFAARLHACQAPRDVVAEALRFTVDELDAGRVIACRRTGPQIVRIDGRSSARSAPPTGAWSSTGLLASVHDPGTVGRLLALDPARDPWLAAQLPQARRSS
jgi:hypothetical protein